MKAKYSLVRDVVMMAVCALVVQWPTLSLAIPGAQGTSSGNVFKGGSPTVMDIGAGVIVGDGASLPGVAVQVVGRLNTELNLWGGVETGAFFYTGSYASAAVIPILATAFTEFTTNSRVRPVIGVSMGPTLTTGGGYSTARFTLLFNPGARIGLGNATELNAQIRLGVLGSSFVVLPQLGVSFAI